jgi:hypothetical protein
MKNESGTHGTGPAFRTEWNVMHFEGAESYRGARASSHLPRNEGITHAPGVAGITRRDLALVRPVMTTATIRPITTVELSVRGLQEHRFYPSIRPYASFTPSESLVSDRG